MDTFKAGTYSDAPPGSLEKGCSETESLYSETSYDCSTQPARTRGRRLFVKHLLIAFGIAALALTWLVASCGKHIFSQLHHTLHWTGNNVGFSRPPPPPGGGLDKCVGDANWTFYDDPPPWALDYPHGAETTLSLPLDSDTLSIISEGPFQHGLVKIEQSTEVTDTVDVRVKVAYYYDVVFERATVCQMERADKEYGIGIFTSPRVLHPPHHWGFEHQLQFDITLTLPASNKGPLLVKRLETHMPDYSQTVADLQESVLFHEISLTSANGRLSVQSITSDVGQFSSLNGYINGHFNARSSLNLATANGRIAPTVNLLHREGTSPCSLTVHTVNGLIDAEVSLISEASVGGAFQVDATSSNGKVGLKFSDAPVDSVLRSRAETIVGDVEVELHSTFEGAYSLQTLLGKKTVSQHDVEDPAGKGRHRLISLNESMGRVEGELKWVENGGGNSGNEGYVVLKTVTSPVKLVV